MNKRGSSLTFFVILALVLGGSLAGLYFLGKASTGEDEPKIERPPEPERAPGTVYLAGGRPNSTGPARAVFKQSLMEFVIDLDSWGRRPNSGAESIADDMSEARGALMSDAKKAGLDPEVLRELEALIEHSLSAASVADSELNGATEALMKQTLKFNDALASASLGFFIDATVRPRTAERRSILLFSFEVLRIILYRSGGHDVRTLRVRRLDTLNFRFNMLGFTAPQRRDAVVLDNKVDEQMLFLLPALAPEMRMDPFHLSKEDAQTAWFTETRILATKIIREELGNAGDESLQKLGGLLARRNEIYAQWNELLDARDMSVSLPTTLVGTWKYRSQMEGLATHAAMDELDDIESALDDDKMLRAFVAAHDHFAQSVERHETQHRLDLAELYTLPMPTALAEYVGELPEGFRGQGSLASAALAELSAYLSEIARDPLTPRLNLTLLAGYMLDTNAWGMGESYASLVIVEGLADELDIAHEAFVVRREIDRSEVARVYQELCRVDTNTLREAAGTLWAKFFGRPLPELELVAR